MFSVGAAKMGDAQVTEEGECLSLSFERIFVASGDSMNASRKRTNEGKTRSFL